MAAVPSTGRATLLEAPRVAPEAAATQGLYERHAARILRYCLHQLGSREEAEDATQTTFMNALRALRRGVAPEAEVAWLFKIAENVCLSRRRSSWRRNRIESPSDFEVIEEIVPGPSRHRDELIGIEDALAAMPEQQRRAILLREWQGLSYREIAEELEISQSAVETLIFRARRSLAQGLTEPEPAKPKRRGLRRALHAFDLGSLVAGLKTVLAGGAAVKATAAAVAVTVTAAATTTAVTVKPAMREPATPAAGAPAAAVSAPPVAAVGPAARHEPAVRAAVAKPAGRAAAPEQRRRDPPATPRAVPAAPPTGEPQAPAAAAPPVARPEEPQAEPRAGRPSKEPKTRKTEPAASGSGRSDSARGKAGAPPGTAGRSNGKDGENKPRPTDEPAQTRPKGPGKGNAQSAAAPAAPVARAPLPGETPASPPAAVAVAVADAASGSSGDGAKGNGGAKEKGKDK